jgi:hypothetical protein
MATKFRLLNGLKRRHILLAAIILASQTPFLMAQPGGYFSDFRISQRLTWTGGEHTSRYEVVIEKEENNRFRPVLRESTDADFIVVSLAPGKYRYRIIPYDFFDLPGESSGWVNIEVREVLSPELNNFSPVVFYLDANPIQEFSVSAKNLTPDTVVFLRRYGGATIFPVDVKVNEGGNSARVFFDNDQLTVGDYEVIVRNPGWLETSREGFSIVYPILPELNNFSPFTFYKDELETYELIVNGKQMIAEAEIFLQDRNGATIVPVETYIREDGSYARLSFDNNQLIHGNYEVVVRNPGKLGASKKGFTIIDRKLVYERELSKARAKYNTIGISAGTSFSVPWLIGTINATLAPFRYSFLEIGLDVGLINGIEDVGYYSLIPFAHYDLFVPFPTKGGWYIGAGGGWYWANHTFDQGESSFNTFIFDLTTGINIGNLFTVSYTVRTNKLTEPESLIDPKKLISKLSLGFVYRFMPRNKNAD